jgi:hypothetical protein
MCSGTTAGLTSQQLLERRREQNKLAQRRFRKKARMARSMGLAMASTSSSRSNLETARSLVLPHILSPASVLATGCGAPIECATLPSFECLSSSASSSSSSPSSSSSSSQPSRVPNPTSSGAELHTPGMPSYLELTKTHMTKSNGGKELSALMTHGQKEQQDWDHHPSLFATSHDTLDHGYPNCAPLLVNPAPTMRSGLLPPSFVDRDAGVRVSGMHSCPLLKQSMQNTTLIPPRTASLLTPSSSMISQAKAFTQAEPVSATDYLDRLEGSPTTTLYDESEAAEDSTETQRKAISGYVARATPQQRHSLQPHKPIPIAPLPFARVVESITARFGLTRGSGGLPIMLSRLELHIKCGSSRIGSGKGLIFDPDVHWGSLCSNMLPTYEQLLYAHRAFVDTCLPWPAVRSRLVMRTLTMPVCEEELALDLLLSILFTDEGVASFHVCGDDVLDPEAWELGERMLQKWWGLFDDSIVRRTNWWRRQRGLEEISPPTLSDSMNDFEKQGLGSGSLAEVHRLASVLC